MYLHYRDTEDAIMGGQVRPVRCCLQNSESLIVSSLSLPQLPLARFTTSPSVLAVYYSGSREKAEKSQPSSHPAIHPAIPASPGPWTLDPGGEWLERRKKKKKKTWTRRLDQGVRAGYLDEYKVVLFCFA